MTQWLNGDLWSVVTVHGRSDTELLIPGLL